MASHNPQFTTANPHSLLRTLPVLLHVTPHRQPEKSESRKVGVGVGVILHCDGRNITITIGITASFTLQVYGLEDAGEPMAVFFP